VPTYDRYLLSQFLTLFGFFSLVLVAVYWVNRAVGLFDRLVANGHSAGVFLEFSILTLPNVIRVVLPVAAFAAAVQVTNRMRTESELVIAQATGLSPLRGARAVVVFGGVAALITLTMTHVLGPMSQNRLDVRNAEIAADVTAGLLVAGQFQHPADDVTLFVANITDRGLMEKVFLSDRRDPAEETTYTSETAILATREGQTFLVMFNGLSQDYDPATGQLETTFFDELTVTVDPARDGPGGRIDLDAVPTPAALSDPADTALRTGSTPRQITVEIAERTAQGLQSFAAPILGFAMLMLGGFSRFSAWRQVTGAIVALVLYELSYRMALGAVLGGTLPPLALFIPTLVFSIVALLALKIAGRPWRPRGANA